MLSRPTAASGAPWPSREKATKWGGAGGPHPDPKGESLLAHCGGEGAEAIYQCSLDGGEVRALRPPGFPVALHPSRGRNGVVVFDAPVE